MPGPRAIGDLLFDRLPRRKSFRLKPSSRGQCGLPAAFLRQILRNDGDIPHPVMALKFRQSLVALLLIDVSGSMKSATDDYLRLAIRSCSGHRRRRSSPSPPCPSRIHRRACDAATKPRRCVRALRSGDGLGWGNADRPCLGEFSCRAALRRSGPRSRDPCCLRWHGARRHSNLRPGRIAFVAPCLAVQLGQPAGG